MAESCSWVLVLRTNRVNKSSGWILFEECMADVCIALPNSRDYSKALSSKTFLWNIYKNDMITCHGVTEGKRNKNAIYELSLHFSASGLSKAELSWLIKAVSSLWFWTYIFHTYHSCWTPCNHSVLFVISDFMSLPCLFNPWIPQARSSLLLCRCRLGYWEVWLQLCVAGASDLVPLSVELWERRGQQE